MAWNKINVNRKQVCIGQMRHKIKIHTREITAPTTDSDFTETIEQYKEVWSGIKTLEKGIELFDGVNLVGTITHIFYIRYFAGITTEYYIEYDSKYYRILEVDNMNEDNKFIALKSTLRGDTSYKANES